MVIRGFSHLPLRSQSVTASVRASQAIDIPILTQMFTDGEIKPLIQARGAFWRLVTRVPVFNRSRYSDPGIDRR